jgi:hypothetical protein
MKPAAQTNPGETARLPRASGWQILASVLILLHVVAVWVAPFSATMPPSPLAVTLRSVFRSYEDAAFLNHGYKFFAPDPGPTHLVRYEIELSDGTQKSGVFPNLKEQWPRLLYHRHMMLSERLQGPPQMTPLIQEYSKSYARHLLKEHDAESVTLYLVTHLLPELEQVQRGMKLDNPSLYREQKLLTLKRGES